MSNSKSDDSPKWEGSYSLGEQKWNTSSATPLYSYPVYPNFTLPPPNPEKIAAMKRRMEEIMGQVSQAQEMLAKTPRVMVTQTRGYSSVGTMKGKYRAWRDERVRKQEKPAPESGENEWGEICP